MEGGNNYRSVTYEMSTSTRLIIRTLSTLGLFAVVLFGSAGRADWNAGWKYIGILTAYTAATIVYLNRVNPEVVEYRMRLPAGTKRWDWVWFLLFAPLFFGTYVVAGFDAVRLGCSSMSDWLWLPGLCLFGSGSALLNWSMGVNPFFEKTVRIQTDRGQYVIDTGPYRLIRHPGYVGFSLWCLSTPLLLGSWWAFLPAVLSIAGIVVRTALEDRTLRLELAGYEEYRERVRYRLIPGLW